MPVDLYTARLGYRGADRLNISRTGDDPLGLALAPSRELLGQALERRDRAGENATLRRAAWEWYAPRYVEEMRQSFAQQRAAWQAIADRGVSFGSLTLMCFEVDATECHRTIAADLLVKAGPRLGVVFVAHGERPPPQTELPL